jgi:hypothetical protein
MATFIQGSTDFIPQIQPWSPDFRFYQNAMATKQSQYDAGWQKTNTLYNSLLNAPMLREEDIAKRDQFFKTIEQDINRLSGIDLSKQQNVDAASQLFTPLIEDENIIDDISRTKQLSNEMQVSENYRNCTGAEDYKNSTAEEALQMRGPKYTPYTNAVEKAFDKLFKNSGKLGRSITQSNGKYMITEKNGLDMIEPLMSYISGTVGRDPEVKAMYNVKARVARRDWLAGNANQYGSPEEAESFYIQNILQPSKDIIEGVKNDVQNTRQTREIEKEILDDDIRANGIIPGSEDDLRYRAVLKDLGILTESEKQLENELGVANSVSRSNNINAMRLNADATAANAMLFDDMLAVAQTYQQLTHEIKQGGADPYAMANYQSGLRLEEAKQKMIWDAELAVQKDALKTEKALKSSKGGWFDNIWGVEDKVLKNDIEKAGNESAYEENKKYEQEITEKLKGPEASYLSAMWNNLFTELPIGEDESWRNAPKAVMNDFINIFLNSNNSAFKNNKAFREFMGEELAQDLLTNKDNIRSFPYKILKRLNENGKSSITSDDLLKLPVDVLEKMYKESERRLNPNVSINDKKATKDIYLLPGMEDLRKSITVQKSLFKMYKDLKKERHQKTEKAFKNFAKTGAAATTVPEWDKETGGLYGQFEPASTAIGFMGLGGYSAYKDGTPAYGGKGSTNLFALNKNSGLGTDENTYNYFIDAGLDLFLDDEGDKVDYNIFEDKMLEKTVSWYKNYKNGILPTEEEWNSSDNISRPMRSTSDYDPEKNAINLTLKQAKKNIHRLYYGEGEKTWGEWFSDLGTMIHYHPVPLHTERADKEGEQLGVGIGLEDIHKIYWSTNEPGVVAMNSVGGGVGGKTKGKVNVLTDINALKYSSDKYLAGLSVLKNIFENSNDVVISDDQLEYTERVGLGKDKNEVVSSLKSFGNYFYNNKYTEDSDYTPNFSMSYDPKIVLNGVDYVSVNIKFDDQYIKDADWVTVGKESSEKNVVKNNRREIAAKGINLLLPKAMANNMVETVSKRSDEDKILQAGGKINLSDYVPNVGTLSFTARPKQQGIYESGYAVTGNIKIFNPVEGKFEMKPPSYFEPLKNIEQMLKNQNIDAGIMRQQLVPVLQELMLYNQQSLLSYKDLHGMNAEEFQEYLKTLNSK